MTVHACVLVTVRLMMTSGFGGQYIYLAICKARFFSTLLLYVHKIITESETIFHRRLDTKGCQDSKVLLDIQIVSKFLLR